jgi:hypothetical protein
MLMSVAGAITSLRQQIEGIQELLIDRGKDDNMVFHIETLCGAMKTESVYLSYTLVST